MKKGILAVFLAGLFALWFASAFEPELVLSKASFQPGETILGQLSGNFETQIKESMIDFYEYEREIPFEYGLLYYPENKTYFFYAYTTRPGNFTLKIPDILYRDEQGNLKSKTIEKIIPVYENFLDTNKTKTEILSIKPGFITADDEPKLVLENLGTENLSANYKNGKTEGEITLIPRESKEILFLPESGFSYLEISSYETFNIPVFYSSEKSLEILEKLTSLKVEPNLLQLKLIAKKDSTEKIRLYNSGNETIKNIEFSLINLSELEEPDEISQLNPGNETWINLSFSPKNQGFSKGQLIIKFEEQKESKSLILPVELYIFPKESNESALPEISQQSCTELKGSVCNETQECSGNFTYTIKGENCCKGLCENAKSETSLPLVIGIIIFVVIAAAIFLIYLKFKKTKPPKPDEKIKEKTEAYEKRISGGLSKT